MSLLDTFSSTLLSAKVDAPLVASGFFTILDNLFFYYPAFVTNVAICYFGAIPHLLFGNDQGAYFY
jgi:hypothetical protein